MISSKIIELINRDLDGTLSEKESMQLESHIESDQEAGAMRAKLRLVHQKLQEMNEIEPPENLSESIMQSLPSGRYLEKRQSSPVASKILELFQVPRFRMAGMFSLGAAAALLLLVISNNLPDSPQTPAEKAIGSILAPEKIGKVVPIELKQLAIDNYKVEISTSRSGKIVFVSINLESESNEPVQLVVSSDETANFRFQALDYSAPNLIQANFGNDFFSAAIAGPGNWVLAFEDSAKTNKTVKIELKTESNSITEFVAVQEISAGKE